jgi:hypothetical protein
MGVPHGNLYRFVVLGIKVWDLGNTVTFAAMWNELYRLNAKYNVTSRRLTLIFKASTHFLLDSCQVACSVL